MASSSSSKEKFFDKVINPNLSEVMKHPRSIEMCDGLLHVWDVKGPKKMGSVEARLKAVEREVCRCQGMVEHGLSANHTMITKFTGDLKVDGRPLEDIILTLNEQINFLQAQIFDIQNQMFEYEERFKVMSLAAICRTLKTRVSSYNGEPLP
ncbi:40S ribosomal protein S5-1 [Hordeum vulgare]|nr:40S ribosomal protein S5-1 [Hordeum vulgare]